MKGMRRLLLAACFGGSLSLAGCAKAPPQLEPPMPELTPPPPPPRIVAIYELESEPLPTLGPEPPEEVQPERPRPIRPRTTPEEAAKAEPARTEPNQPRSAAVPALTLKPMAGSEAKTEASIRSLLARASRDLARVNPGGLDSDGRTQHDQARRFLQQAEEALKSGNLLFAGKLADKAATLAAVLVR
jgi:hypothetical protein